MDNITTTSNIKELLEKQLQLLSEQSEKGLADARELAIVSETMLNIIRVLIEL